MPFDAWRRIIKTSNGDLRRKVGERYALQVRRPLSGWSLMVLLWWCLPMAIRAPWKIKNPNSNVANSCWKRSTAFFTWLPDLQICKMKKVSENWTFSKTTLFHLLHLQKWISHFYSLSSTTVWSVASTVNVLRCMNDFFFSSHCPSHTHGSLMLTSAVFVSVLGYGYCICICICICRNALCEWFVQRLSTQVAAIGGLLQGTCVRVLLQWIAIFLLQFCI